MSNIRKSFTTEDLNAPIITTLISEDLLIPLVGLVDLPLDSYDQGIVSTLYDKVGEVPLFVPRELIPQRSNEALLRAMFHYAKRREEPLFFQGHYSMQEQIYTLARVQINIRGTPYSVPVSTETYIKP